MEAESSKASEQLPSLDKFDEFGTWLPKFKNYCKQECGLNAAILTTLQETVFNTTAPVRDTSRNQPMFDAILEGLVAHRPDVTHYTPEDIDRLRTEERSAAGVLTRNL